MEINLKRACERARLFGTKRIKINYTSKTKSHALRMGFCFESDNTY